MENRDVDTWTHTQITPYEHKSKLWADRQQWRRRLAPGPNASFHSTSLLDACSIHASPLEGKRTKWSNSHGSVYLGKSVQPTERHMLGIQVYIISWFYLQPLSQSSFLSPKNQTPEGRDWKWLSLWEAELGRPCILWLPAWWTLNSVKSLSMMAGLGCELDRTYNHMSDTPPGLGCEDSSGED